jgi:dolichol kinase
MISDEQKLNRALFSKISAVALLIAIFPIWPYFFYQALKLIVFGTSVYSAHLYNKEHKRSWMLIMIGIAIVFNPINPLYFGHFLWSIVDGVAAIIFFRSPK